ncbi:MAG: ATP-binding cassette domain-containing protein [Candidatus Peregrinibacteria bacterium]|nr:ATP-binding cassette domain-containing protein [Candidatus Peregrinibacteria bacterium]MCB9808727.1 ATP-binding cassette domain-containing protein [Candidatus Peribacteria bacterium]
MIELKNVSKSYGKTTVLQNISFTVNPGEFVCITGPSGAGKSTLLHLLTGAETVTKGSIEIDGVNLNIVPPGALQIFRQRLGIVFQDYKLLKNRTIAENIAFPLEVCGVPDSDIAKRVRTVLKLVELTKHADSLPSEISGGEKARAAVGRAVVHDPMIILADEPTGNIDPNQSKTILNLFNEIHASGTTIILATHDTALVDALNTRVIELSDGAIVRDSVGGYKGKKPKAEKHDILEEDADEGNDKKKKVKVTAIS